MFSGMGMQRAIGTSLLVITLISASGTASHLLAGKDLSLATAGVFTAGSIAGLFAGSGLAQRLAGPALQKSLCGGDCCGRAVCHFSHRLALGDQSCVVWH